MVMGIYMNNSLAAEQGWCRGGFRGGSTGVIRAPLFQNEPSFLATPYFLPVSGNKIITTFFHSCFFFLLQQYLIPHQLIDTPSWNFYCYYVTDLVRSLQSRASSAYIVSGQNLVVVACSILFLHG